MLPIGGWALIAAGALLGVGSALVVTTFGPKARLQIPVAAGAVVGALSMVCWGQVVGVGPLWSAARGTQPPPWVTDSLIWPAGGAVVAGGFAALAVSESVRSMHGRRWSPESNRTLTTLVLVCVTGYLGSAALGTATAVVTTSPEPPGLSIWSTAGVERVDLKVDVGEQADWDADPAFVTGPVAVAITVRGTPGQIEQVVLVGDQYLETSRWKADTQVVEVDPRDLVLATQEAAQCVDRGITGTGWFTSARALMVDVRVSDDGSGHAHLTYTDERRWWRASGGRSQVSLPTLSFGAQGSCVMSNPESDAWFVPPAWSLVEQASQPNLGAGDLVVVYRVDDGQSELFRERSAARWTLRSGSEDRPDSLAPTYRLETVNTRSHSTTYAFVAALMFGVALTGIFELLRSVTLGRRLGVSAMASRPEANSILGTRLGGEVGSARQPEGEARRDLSHRRVTGVLAILALLALIRRRS